MTYQTAIRNHGLYDHMSAMKFLSNANNNLNVLTHPAYYTLRSSIKNKQRYRDNMNLLCVDKPIECDSAVPIGDVSVPAGTRGPEHKLVSGMLPLYDPGSFDNGRTYLLDTDEPFSREDFLEALRGVTHNPLMFMNSRRYDPMANAEERMCALANGEENVPQVEPLEQVSFLNMLDPTNLVKTCFARSLFSVGQGNRHS